MEHRGVSPSGAQKASRTSLLRFLPLVALSPIVQPRVNSFFSALSRRDDRDRVVAVPSFINYCSIYLPLSVLRSRLHFAAIKGSPAGPADTAEPYTGGNIVRRDDLMILPIILFFTRFDSRLFSLKSRSAEAPGWFLKQFPSSSLFPSRSGWGMSSTSRC